MKKSLLAVLSSSLLLFSTITHANQHQNQTSSTIVTFVAKIVEEPCSLGLDFSKNDILLNTQCRDITNRKMINEKINIKKLVKKNAIIENQRYNITYEKSGKNSYIMKLNMF